jgi:photosystem II stability/assembly factor-like uncharacterized protein
MLVLGLLTRVTLPSHADEPQSLTREQQIAEVEKQLNELTKKLNALKTAETTSAAAPAAPAGTIPDEWTKNISWRGIGPAQMGGRITAISVYEADPSTYWVATGGGGLVKTSNNGITFEHQFDHEATVAIGDVCVAPSNKDIVWVGTGENNPRNSVSYGDGVYKSTDGGKTWKNMGLKKSFQIGKIIVHPTNPDIVYVGALGRLYGPNEERGLYKTTDGGKNWERILFVDDKTGIIDMHMSPTDPETLIVATWERKRDEYDAFFENPPVPDEYGPVVTHAPGTALYKTTDGGKSFKKLTQGLPTAKLGRIGLDWSRKSPKVVFAIIDTEKAGTGTPPSTVYMGVQGDDAKPGAKLTSITKDGPAEKAGLKTGDVILKLDGKDVEGYDQFTEAVRQRKAGDKLKLEVKRGSEKPQEITLTLAPRPNEGGPGGGRGAGGGGGGGGRQIVSAGFRGEDESDGVKVTTVQDNGPAAKAGLKVDDVVLTVDGKPIGEFRTFMMETSQEHKVGDKIKLGVQRGKEKLTLTVTLEMMNFGFGGRGGGGGGGGLPGGPSRARPYSSGLGGQQANVQDQQGKDSFQTGGIFRSEDAGETWKRINSLNPRPMYFSLIRVDPTDDKNVYVGGVGFTYSTDGGKRFTGGKDRGVHSDHHALWIDPRDGRHMIIGTDGGFYVSYDRGENWDHHNFMALGQFYHCVVDPRLNYKVYGGLQDNGSWGGPAFSPRGGIVNDDWIMVGGGDGFVCRVDPTDPEQIYCESQGGAINRRNYRTGERGSATPRAGGRGQGRGGRAGGDATQGAAGGGRGARGGNAAPGAAGGEGSPAPGGAQRHRFNWNTPFILSNHNPSIFYSAGEYVFRSVKKGDDLKIISPELTRSKMGSATALSESPRSPDILWAGTDDGNVWITRDGGQKWVNVADNIKKAGLPGYCWVASIEASRYADGRAYVCFDAHRSDDDKPYLFVTEDYGETFKPIAGNLPNFGSSRCLCEDIRNQNVLYCGTEFGAWASVNRGVSWTKINGNLPTVAVHEFAQHPLTGELVAATHGRSIWITDITPIRQMSADTIKEKAHLYAPALAVRWRTEANRSMFAGAERIFVGQNAPRGVAVYYSLGQKAQKVELTVLDYAGQVVRRLEARTEPGLHKATWDLARLPNAPASGGGGGGRRFGGGGGGPGGFGGFGAQAGPGTYRALLVVDGKEFSQPIHVEADPTAPAQLISSSEQGENEVVNPDEDEDHDLDKNRDPDKDEEAREREQSRPRRIDD